MPGLKIERYGIPPALQGIDLATFDVNEVDLDEITLPRGEDFGIKSDEEEEDQEEVITDTGFGTVIVVDNLPAVPPEKHEKLTGVIRKIFSQIGQIREPGGLWLPVDEATQHTKGYAFVEFLTPQEAAAAQEQTNGYRLDKAHVFAVSMFDDLDRFAKVPATYAPPPPKAPPPRENLQSWMMDPHGRDQFAIRYADESEIFWNDAKAGKPEEAYRRTAWTESSLLWSPKGTFIATMHRQGIALWGGPAWAKLQRLQHAGVRLMDFSPNERYLVTYSLQEAAGPREASHVVLMLWDLRTGRKLRTFTGPQEEFLAAPAAGAAPAFSWPVFHWAGGPDDKYFARIGKNQISVYSAPDMTLLDKKSLKVDNVLDFQWSPSEPIMAIYQPESQGGNQPARVSLVAFPSRAELRQKNLFSVSDIRMLWQPQGDYLAMRVDRHTKSKKSTYTGFELFSLREKDVPMEVLEFENKAEKIVAFAWEPRGPRFGVIHGEGPRPDVSFYTMGESVKPMAGAAPAGGPKLRLLGTLKSRPANALYWAKAGGTCVLAGLKSLNGQLEFFNVGDMETLGTAEHFMCTDVDWDPTGRYVATSVTSVHQMENGFNMYSFTGRLLYKVPRDRFFQFLWRPRVPSQLTADKEAEIAKSLRKYTKRYDELDEERRLQADTEFLSSQKVLTDEWRAWQARKAAQLEAQRPERDALVASSAFAVVEDDGDFQQEEVEVEEVVDIHEEIIMT